MHNMLASCGVNFPIRLDPFHNEFQDLGAEYEPEVFPGVIFSMKEPKVTVLIFVSGRFVRPPSPFLSSTLTSPLPSLNLQRHLHWRKEPRGRQLRLREYVPAAAQVQETLTVAILHSTSSVQFAVAL